MTTENQEIVNFLCRLTKEDHNKLKTIALAYNRSMTAQIRQFIQDDFRKTGGAYEEHLAGRQEQAEEFARNKSLSEREEVPF